MRFDSPLELHQHANVARFVMLGHGSTIYSSTIMDESVIGIGCVLDADTLVESHAMLAAGSVVPSGTRIPSGQVRFLDSAHELQVD